VIGYGLRSGIEGVRRLFGRLTRWLRKKPADERAELGVILRVRSENYANFPSERTRSDPFVLLDRGHWNQEPLRAVQQIPQMAMVKVFVFIHVRSPGCAFKSSDNRLEEGRPSEEERPLVT
jgi:hypothetical protein